MKAHSMIDRPPGKALRFGLRLPIWLYRLQLGWLLGSRFLLLTHTGRKSGLLHRTVIEVVGHDKPAGFYYVVSGWGEKADWYQNVQRAPMVRINVGGHEYVAEAEFIPFHQAVGILEAYARSNALAFRELSSLFLGERLLPDSDAARRLAEKMPMVAFRIGQEAHP